MGSFRAEDNEAPTFEPIQVSWQPMILVEAKKKETKAGTGHYMNATFKVIEGEFAGRMVFSIFNLDNPNERATEISRGQLANLMKAVDVEELDDMWDWSELFSKPFAARLKVIPAKGEYDAKNDIGRFDSLSNQDVDTDTGEQVDAPWEDGK